MINQKYLSCRNDLYQIPSHAELLPHVVSLVMWSLGQKIDCWILKQARGTSRGEDDLCHVNFSLHLVRASRMKREAE